MIKINVDNYVAFLIADGLVMLYAIIFLLGYYNGINEAEKRFCDKFPSVDKCPASPKSLLLSSRFFSTRDREKIPGINRGETTLSEPTKTSREKRGNE